MSPVPPPRPDAVERVSHAFLEVVHAQGQLDSKTTTGEVVHGFATAVVVTMVEFGSTNLASDIEKFRCNSIRVAQALGKLKVGCAACDRGDYQLGHADDCPRARPAPKSTAPPIQGDELDDDAPLWCINEQIKGLLEGEGATEDHESVISFLLSTGLPVGTVRRMHHAIVCGDAKVLPS